MRAAPGQAATTVGILTATWTRAVSSLRRKSAWVSSQYDALTNEFSALKLAARRDNYRCPYQETKVLSTAVHTSFSRRSGLKLEMSSLSQPVAAKSRASA